MADIFEISGRIHSTSQEEVVTTSSEILDEEQNKKQSEVNADVDTALADRYTKEETYSKSQLDNLITTPAVQYVSVTATAQTTAVTDVLPATGAADTVYRVGSWDGSAFDAGKYSEYAWNGTAYQLLAVRSGSLDGVYDISANNLTEGQPTQYADLAAALGTNGANVPVGVRAGGMQVRFINSTSGKYEQCLYIGTDVTTAATFTNVANWQGVDETPTAGSQNLVTSGGVFPLQFEVFGISWESGYVNQMGVIVAPDGYSQIVSELLTKEQANQLTITFGSAYRVRLSYYQNGSFVSRGDVLSSPVSISTDKDVRIVLHTYNQSNYTMSQMLSAYTFNKVGLVKDVENIRGELEDIAESIDNISDDVQQLENYFTDFEFEWGLGNIDGSGNITQGTQSNYYSQIIPKSIINNVSIASNSLSYQWNLAFYDGTTFVGRYGWTGISGGKVKINTDYNVRIMIAATNTTDTKPVADMLPNYTLEGFPTSIATEVANLDARVDALEAREDSDYLKYIVECCFDGKVLHVSVDDVCWCLYDLIQNSSTYTSIFDEPFFAMLKEVHDTNGMVFTLNTFNEIDTNTSGYYPSTFDISDVPNKFQSEFQANKSWLKFAFHAKDENTNYNEDTGAGTDYATFVSSIYTLTGDYGCIDRITRLGYFGGTLANCLELKSASHGVIGFLGADDTRNYDYYLTSSQYSVLRAKGKFIDVDNSLLFIKTQYRTFSTAKLDVESNMCFQKLTEFFFHEYEGHTSDTWSLNALKTKLLDLGTWATGLNYMFVYPSVIYG